MQRKFLLTTILIIMIIFSFTINCYASTYYSVETSTDKYQLSLSFKKLLNLDIPDVLVSTTFDSSNIYFVLLKGLVESVPYRLMVASTPFYVSEENSDMIFIDTVGDSNITYLYYENGKWVHYSGIINRFFIEDRSDVIISSDDIKSGSTVFKTSYSELPVILTSVENVNVMSEIIYILPVVLAILVSIVAIRKGIKFIKRKTQSA